MPIESFLINPVRRKRKVSSKGLPSKLLSRMIRTHGIKEGMRKAWKSFKGGETKSNIWKGDPKGHRKAAKKGWKRRIEGHSGMAYPLGGTFPRYNPFGEEVMIVGANPRRRKRRYVMKRKRRRNPLGLLAGNRAVTRYRRRRNPVAGRVLGSNITLDRPSTLLYPIAIGVASKMATERIPSILRITAPVTRYVIQGAIGIGGGMLLSNAIGKTNATIWTVVSGATILADMLNRFVFRTALGYIREGEEDLLAQEDYLAQDAEQIEAFPEEVADGLAAFPDELGAFPYEASPVY